MECIDQFEYDNICKSATVLEGGCQGEKVFALPDGNFLKLFRLKGFFSSAFFYPYAQRFTDNICILHQLDIPCPEVIRVARINTGKMKYDAVFYRPLAGTPLRHWVTCPPDTNDDELLRAGLGTFVAHLHQTGIYFRSLHLGNIILTPDNCFGLIDVDDLVVQRFLTPFFAHRFGLIGLTDLPVRRYPLTPSLAHRNFHHLLRYECDRLWLLGADQGNAFYTAYCHVRGNSAHYPKDMLTKIPSSIT